jgi:hypothetical protein
MADVISVRSIARYSNSTTAPDADIATPDVAAAPVAVAAYIARVGQFTLAWMMLELAWGLIGASSVARTAAGANAKVIRRKIATVRMGSSLMRRRTF